MADATRWPFAVVGALCVAFVLLATANSGGYRFGISDQAFYEPAVERQLDASLFPRDRALIDSQARLTLVDETLADVSRITRLQAPSLFLLLYLVSLVALFLGAWQFARLLGFSPWAAAAFLALLTLRHRIAKTGANTLEGYMHPRQLAFGLGVLALVASLKNRWTWMVALWAVSAALHPTTALWFAILIGGGIVFDRISRFSAKAASALLILIAMLPCLVTWPLLRHLPSSLFIDTDWAAVLAGKDYIFVSQWPIYAWIANLAYAPLIWWIFKRRTAIGAAKDAEGRIVAGTLALLAIFIGSLFLSESRVALAVQLQVSRVFWLMDFLVAGYIAWWLTSDPALRRLAGAWTPRVAVAILAVVSIGRGVQTVSAGGADRVLFRRNLPPGDWTDVMGWLRTQPSDWLILANPDHAWRYGTSVRVAAARDVVLEGVKDSAISLYDRNVAMRVAERMQSLSNFSDLSTDDARALGRRYSATVLVAERSQRFNLPQLYSNNGFAVYDLR
jgi:hypothetical protein